MNGVSDMPLPEQRKYLSEQVRIAQMKFIALDDNAGRLEDGRKILLSEMELNLVDSGECSSNARAEKVAITSEQYKRYLKKMHDARREANDARAEWSALERDYWSTVSNEASERQQMRMSRG
jgi:hypothetical protein